MPQVVTVRSQFNGVASVVTLAGAAGTTLTLGSGVNTFLTTPSLTNFLAALTGETTPWSSLASMSNPGAITFLRINANNTVTALSAADFAEAIELGVTDAPTFATLNVSGNLVANELFVGSGSPFSVDDVGNCQMPTLFLTALGGGFNAADFEVTRLKLRDTAQTLNAAGNITGATNVDIESANVYSGTLTGSVTFTFSNPPATGIYGELKLIITGNNTATMTFPAGVDWGTIGAPATLGAGEVIVMTFATTNAGTKWRGTWQDGYT